MTEALKRLCFLFILKSNNKLFNNYDTCVENSRNFLRGM